MSPNSNPAVLRSSLTAYLEELAESGIDGLPATDNESSPHSVAATTIPETTRQAVRSQGSAVEHHESLDKIRKDLGDCQGCKLSTTKKKLVFGVGNPQARLVFVGDATDAGEDLKGEPFAGESGQVLNRIITAMGLQREDIYLCNVVKCPPANDHVPTSEEISACSPFLLRQVQSVKPEAIVALGTFAAQALLGTKEPMSRLRGKFRDFNGIPIMPTLHPSDLLRNKGNAGLFWDVWDDMTQVLRLLKLPVPDKSRKTS